MPLPYLMQFKDTVFDARKKFGSKQYVTGFPNIYTLPEN